MIDPVALQLGPISIRWYGIVYVAGFLILGWYLKRHKKALALTKKQVDSLLVYTILGLLIGGRLGHMLLTDFSLFIANPASFFFIWQGGMSFFGALAGIILSAWLFVRNNYVPILPILDKGVLVASAILIFGRLANYINQELPGRAAPWCESCTHPYVLYAAVSHVLLFCLLFFLRNRLKRGQLFSVFFIGYGTLRLLTDLFRADPTYFGLTIWQYASIIMTILGCVLFYLIWRKDTRSQKY
jgi:phosphatidylglycerol:prolipoprotein diacylglycerol transferase